MATTTIDLSKVITVITPVGKGFQVTTHKMGDFESLLSKYNDIKFKGVTSITKFDKYSMKLISKGFKKVKTNYSQKNSPVDGAISFSIDYKK
jgi:hypothetical protein